MPKTTPKIIGCGGYPTNDKLAITARPRTTNRKTPTPTQNSYNKLCQGENQLCNYLDQGRMSPSEYCVNFRIKHLRYKIGFRFPCSAYSTSLHASGQHLDSYMYIIICISVYLFYTNVMNCSVIVIYCNTVYSVYYASNIIKSQAIGSLIEVVDQNSFAVAHSWCKLRRKLVCETENQSNKAWCMQHAGSFEIRRSNPGVSTSSRQAAGPLGEAKSCSLKPFRSKSYRNRTAKSQTSITS